HLAEGDVHGKLVGERLRRVGRIGRRVERVYVSDERALGVRQVGDDRVRRVETRRTRVGIARVLGKEIVVVETEQRRVAPVARVKLLAVNEQEPRAGYRIWIGAEIADVRDSLLLVH